jgi:hypothetical protein
MTPNYAFWSVVDSSQVDRLQGSIRSARQRGVFKDFHVWSDQPIEQAICHPVPKLDQSTAGFKFTFLRDFVKQLNYDYFVWLGADSYFVRNPGQVLRVLHGSPVHATLECDACASNNRATAWCNCSLSRYARLMQARGVKNRSIFSVDAGFWIVHHDVIDRFCDLALDFWELWKRDGHDPNAVEPALANAVQLLCGNPYQHTLANNSELWAADRLGCYRTGLPDGRPWMYEDEFSGDRCLVNPAIVHAIGCKDLLAATGRRAANRSDHMSQVPDQLGDLRPTS